jgi:uncharacterized protein (UPF0332 family)
MDEEVLRRTVEQFIDLFFRPEIERRSSEGTISTPFVLDKAQVVFYPDGRKAEVRLNDEVQAIAKVNFKPGTVEGKRPGDEMTADQIQSIEEVMLPDTDDPDAGHATFIHMGGGRWVMGFDFRYNKGLSERHLSDAREFLDAAKHCLGQSAWSAFADNLFSAAELAARALLLMVPDSQFRTKTNHKAIHARFNNFARYGNVSESGREVFNKLAGLRPTARYGGKKVSLIPEEARALFQEVEALVGEVARSTFRERPPGG